MSTQTYAVVTRDNRTLNVRADRKQAMECLEHYRAQGIECKLVFETCKQSGECSESIVTDFDQGVNE